MLAPATGALTAKPETCRFHTLARLTVFTTYDTSCLAAVKVGRAQSMHTYVRPRTPFYGPLCMQGVDSTFRLPKSSPASCLAVRIRYVTAVCTFGNGSYTTDRPPCMQGYQQGLRQTDRLNPSNSAELLQTTWICPSQSLQDTPVQVLAATCRVPADDKLMQQTQSPSSKLVRTQFSSQLGVSTCFHWCGLQSPSVTRYLWRGRCWHPCMSCDSSAATSPCHH